MELDEAVVIDIDKLIKQWLINDKPKEEMEMEAVFGKEGVVDASTFMAVAQRLRAKGYEPLPQDDRMSILVPTGLRFSIEGVGALTTMQNYCRDNKIQGKSFTVLSKSRHSPEESSKTIVEDYNFYIKNRIEEQVEMTDDRVRELLENWPQVEKAFRLIKRWTFRGKGIRIDMSMVRSTPSLNKQFLWQKTFQDRVEDRDIFNQPIRYEIEVELQRDEHTKTEEGARRCLIHGIGEILRAIQKNTFLITKPEADRVLADYTALNKSGTFRGVQPITMEVKHMTKLEEGSLDEGLPNVRRNYNVTDKADGLRVLAYCNGQGELYLIDGGMTIYKTGLMNKACYDCLLDGEWVTRSITNKAISHILLFDIYNLNGVNVSQLPFFDPENVENRYLKMQEWMRDWKGSADGPTTSTVRGMAPGSKFQVKLKHFEFATAESPNTIFLKCDAVLKAEQEYHTDGLILSPNRTPLPQKSGDTFWEQFKWKPANANTIDFLVQFEKQAGSKADRVDVGTNSEGTTVSYKTLRLLVGSTKDPAFDDPRATVLNEGVLPPNKRKRQKMQGGGRREKVSYQASYFIPQEYPDVMANTCYLPAHLNEETKDQYVETEDTKEPIREQMIVEMRYDPSRSPGWRWIPMRIRHDKTERFARGLVSRTFNSELNANGVWNSIHNPITLSMITTGSEKPSLEELALLSRKKRYYNRDENDKDITLVRGLRDFHNHWIKGRLLYKSTLGSGGKTLLDMACGPGGDLRFWTENKTAFVLGVDIDEDNIRNNKNGIYARYMNYLIEYGREKVPPMVFVEANSALPLLKGAAASGSEDKDILRALFSKERTEGSIPPLVTKLAGRLREGADVASCMFALHYFLKDMETFNGFLENLKECVKIGGYFIGCCTDGEQVFKLLEEVAEGEPVVGRESRKGFTLTADTTEVTNEALLWSITKRYEADELKPDESSVGLPIDVKFISIGAEHTEYLVNFEYLKTRLDEIGFTLPTKAELDTLPGGLQHSTNLFETSYDMVPNAEKEYPMSDAAKEFSFLSRWFIFKRRADVEVVSVAPKTAAVEEVETNEEEEEEEPEGTVKVVPGKSAASKLPLLNAVFEPTQIFQFGPEVGPKDPFEIGDDRGPKILAPYWPWPIVDEEDDAKTEYPSLEHYWAAMMMKHGANKPDLAIKLFSTTIGTVHKAAKEEMSRQGLTPNPKTNAKKALLSKLLLEELISIKNVMSPDILSKDYKAVVDPAKWNSVKDFHYRRGLESRWTKDLLFHKIVEKAREQKKYLLYSIKSKVGDPTGELAGMWRSKSGQIEGENKIGRLLMEIADFTF